MRTRWFVTLLFWGLFWTAYLGGTDGFWEGGADFIFVPMILIGGLVLAIRLAQRIPDPPGVESQRYKKTNRQAVGSGKAVRRLTLCVCTFGESAGPPPTLFGRIEQSPAAIQR